MATANATSAQAERVHLAIVEPRYLEMIVAGEKTVECRLSRARREPLGSIAAGERIYFKARGGGVGCSAVATRVEEFHGLSERGVAALRQRYDAMVRGEDAFWTERLGARYAVLVHLGSPRLEAHGPAFKPKLGDRRAWFVLPASLAPSDASAPTPAAVSSSG